MFARINKILYLYLYIVWLKKKHNMREFNETLFERLSFVFSTLNMLFLVHDYNIAWLKNKHKMREFNEGCLSFVIYIQ